MFYQGGQIYHLTHIPGTFDQSSYKSEYNAACTSGMALSHFSMLNNELFNRDTYVVPEQAPYITLDIKWAICMNDSGKDTKHTRHITRRIHSTRNSE